MTHKELVAKVEELEAKLAITNDFIDRMATVLLRHGVLIGIQRERLGVYVGNPPEEAVMKAIEIAGYDVLELVEGEEERLYLLAEVTDIARIFLTHHASPPSANKRDQSQT